MTRSAVLEQVGEGHSTGDNQTPNADADPLVILQRLAAAASVEADGDLDLAANILLKRAPAYQHELALYGSRELVRRHRHAVHAEVWNGDRTGRGERLATAMRHEIASLYQYPLSTGATLGDAMRSDLRRECEMHRQLARTNGLRARWYALILDGMTGDDVRVRDCYGSAELEALRKRAEKDS